MDYYQQTPAQVVEALKSSTSEGLNFAETQRRQEVYGFNTLSEDKGRTILDIFFAQFKTPVVYLLVALSLITFFLKEFIDTFFILFTLLFYVVLGFIQEEKADSALSELKKLSAARVQVIREGKEQTIDENGLVPGDIVILNYGDRVAADLRLLESKGLEIDESFLTGESLPIIKKVAALDGSFTVADQKNMCFSGGAVTKGSGLAIVVATGNKTYLGQIAKSVGENQREESQLQKTLGKITFYISISLVVLVVLIFVGGLFEKEKLAELVIFSVALSLAAIPEGLPLVVSMALMVSINRLVKVGAIVRRIGAIESLGEVDVLAVDKTGTLTKNQMEVLASYTNDEKTMLEVCILCNDASVQGRGDPLEVALLKFAQKEGINIDDIRQKNKSLAEIPFDADRRFMATLNQFDGQTDLLVKGAPYEILKNCKFEKDNQDIKPLTDVRRQEILSKVRSFAEEAEKPILLAAGVFSGQADDTFKNLPDDLAFVAIVSVGDQVREEAYSAVVELRRMGIRLLMLTGDHRLTAIAIARKLKLAKDEKVVKGDDLVRLKGEDLDSSVLAEATIFARVTPLDKLTIVESLQKQGRSVAMTGDGVNDAPSLKRANVGIAMGEGGTEVAKGASDIIITDNNIQTIVAAIKEGRIFFQNLKKILIFLFSTNLGEVMLAFWSFIFGLPLPLFPTQLLWLNLITDAPTSNALIFEKGENDSARKNFSDRHFFLDKVGISRIILTAAVMSLVSVVWFTKILSSYNLGIARTSTLTLLTFFQFFQVFNLRSEKDSVIKFSLRENLVIPISIALSFMIQAMVVELPLFQRLLHTVSLPIGLWLWILGLSLIIVLVEEIRKVIFRIVVKS